MFRSTRISTFPVYMQRGLLTFDNIFLRVMYFLRVIFQQIKLHLWETTILAVGRSLVIQHFAVFLQCF